MTSTTLAIAACVCVCLCIGLLGGLVLMVDLYKKLVQLISDTYSLQRMITSHGDTQLTTDGRLSTIDQKLENIQQRNLKLQSLVSGFSSIEAADTMVGEGGITDAHRLALESGLTEREASLMIQLRKRYSTDITSPTSGAK